MGYRFSNLGLLCWVLTQSACSISYVDAKRGTYNLWGFGHLTMKANPATNNCVAVVNGIHTFGLGLQIGSDDYGLTLGGNARQKLSIYGKDTYLELSAPTNRLAPNFFEYEVKLNP